MPNGDIEIVQTFELFQMKSGPSENSQFKKHLLQKKCFIVIKSQVLS